MTLPAAPMSVVPEPQPTAPARPSRAVDVALRIVGGAVAVVAGVLAAVLDLLLATWAWEIIKGRPDMTAKLLTGASFALGGIAVAVALTVAVSWFAHAAVGTRWAVVLPALPWFVVIVAGGFRTTEGDLLLGGDNLLGLGLIVAAAVTFAAAGFRQLVAPPAGRPGD